MKLSIFSIAFLLLLASCTKDGIGTSEETFTPDVSALPGPGGGGGNGDNTAGVITAGEWHDLTHWAFWNDLVAKDEFSSLPSQWDFDLNDRISVRLSNDEEQP